MVLLIAMMSLPLGMVLVIVNNFTLYILSKNICIFLYFHQVHYIPKVQKSELTGLKGSFVIKSRVGWVASALPCIEKKCKNCANINIAGRAAKFMNT